VIVPTRLVLSCDTEMLPTTAVRVVMPLAPRPWPDCSTLAVPETVPRPSLDIAVTVQAPAKFMPEFPLEPLLLLLLLLHAMGSIAKAQNSKIAARKRKFLIDI